METAWIKVFILSLTQCIAPAGKTICQEETVEYQFASDEDCARALVQMIDLAARADNVLVNRQKTQCTPAVKESSVFSSNSEAATSPGTNAAAVLVDDAPPSSDFLQTAHEKRLSSTQTCDATNGVAPCKIGSIIVEPGVNAEKAEVWRQQE